MSITTQKLQNFLTEYRGEIRESAFGLLKEELPALKPEDFALYEKTGNRLIYEAAYFGRRKFLALLGMEAVLEAEESGTVDGALLKKLSDVLENICAEETWALPAHVNRQENSAWRKTVDLFASETAQTLAELLDRLNPFLPENLMDAMELEISRRVLEPYYGSRPPYASWEAEGSNWAAVCAGSIGSTCMHLVRAGRRLPKPLSDCLERVCAAMSCYFQSFSDDGACMEGLQYYTYGMTYFANFAWELQELTGKNLFDRPDIAAFPAKCFFKDGVSLSFSDGSKNDTFRVGLQALQALMYGEAFFPPMERAAHLHSDPCYRFAGLKLDWFATKAYLGKMGGIINADKKPLNEGTVREGKGWPATETDLRLRPPYRFHILPSAQWCVGYAADGTGFACKGGHNGEPHNHNDIGHFIYEADGVLFLTDLGAGEYTKGYFSKDRYQVLCNNSFGHSVPILNGLGQSAGEAYRCTAFSAAVLPAGIAEIRMEFGGAYSLFKDGEPLDGKAVRREMQFDLETGNLTVTDSFDFRNVRLTSWRGPEYEEKFRAGDESLNVSLTENLVTQIPPVIENNRVYLAQNGAKAVVEVAEAPDMPPPDISVVTHDHHNHEGGAEKVYGIRWDVSLQNGSGISRFTVRRMKA